MKTTNGFPGDIVTIEVSLRTGDAVAGTQNDLVLDARAPIRARDDGEPDCAGNPAIGKEAFSNFLPPGCTPGVDCSAVRVLVISLTNVDPIPSGSVLYTCNVAISPDARLGDAVPLPCENAGLGQPARGGAPRPAAAGGRW